MNKTEKQFTSYGAECTPKDDFDWALYENGYVGGNSMVANRKIRQNGKDVCYCHEAYAGDAYEAYENWFNGRVFAAKDSKKGALHTIDDIRAISDHEVVVDSANGMSSVIDLNKEVPFLRTIGLSNAREFIHCIVEHAENKAVFLQSGLCTKVVDNNRVSMWEGHCAKIEAEFFDELRHKEAPKYGYAAKILSWSNGGYTVDIDGVKCFLPNSLAASGPVIDYNALIGKDVKVCVVNYSPNTRNFVVSHKKYLEVTLASRVAKELAVGKLVSVKVTGQTRNGLFCAIKDEAGEYSFSSLMHRSVMSSDMEASFDRHEFRVGDVFKAYIHKLNWVSEKECRIVIGNREPEIENKEEDNGSAK